MTESKPKISFSLGGLGQTKKLPTHASPFSNPGAKNTPITRNPAVKNVFGGDDSDDERRAQKSDAQQVIVFGEPEKSQVEERVIQGVPNARKWAGMSDRQRPPEGYEAGPTNAKAQEGETLGDDGLGYGLNLLPSRKKRKLEDTNKEIPPREADAPIAQNGNSMAEERDLDAEAIAALTSGQVDNAEENGQAIIRPSSRSPTPPPRNETDAFRRHFHNAPQQATLEQYQATPVEGFGAAILRGYLPPGKTLEELREERQGPIKKNKSGVLGGGPPGTKRKKGENQEDSGAPVKRPGLLGLGATAEGEVGVELGAWGKGAKKGKDAAASRAKTEPQIYVPLMLKNRNTGEMTTESELKDKLAAQSKQQDDSSRDESRHRDRDRPSASDRDRDERDIESRRKRDKDDEDRGKRKDGDRYSGRDRDRDRDRRRDRDRDDDRDRRDQDRDRHRRRDRRRDYSSDSEDRNSRRRDKPRHQDEKQRDRRHRDRSIDGDRDRRASRK